MNVVNVTYRFARIAAIVGLLLIAFSTIAPDVTAQDTPEATAEPLPSAYPRETYTFQRADGNRIVSGQGTFPEVEVTDLTVESTPVFLVGDASENRYWGQYIEWGVSLPGGSFHDYRMAYRVSDAPLPNQDSGGSPGTGGDARPMMVRINARGKGVGFSGNNFGNISPLTHPTLFGNLAFYISTDYTVTLWQGDSGKVIEWWVRALPDARIAVNQQGDAALYAAATNRYPHGVLGDDLEGEILVMFDPDDRTETRVALPDNDVFEGIMPFWADVDGDGSDDVVTTVSNASVGAQIRVYRRDGSLLAAGDPIGQGQRWRHQLAFGAFGPNGEEELVAVRTPHIGGIVEYYRLNGDRLEIVAELPGYTSHVIGSRNLDMAVGGDFNGDGQLEMVLPDQSLTTLNGIQRTADGAAVVWTLPLDGTLTSNLAVIAPPNGEGTLILAAGTADNRLRVWR